MPGVGDVAVGAAAGADAVSGPESRSLFVEGDVSFAFECCFTRGVPEQEVMGFKPLAEVLGLGATLRVGEAGDGGHAVMDEGSVGEEYHVRAAGFGMKKTDVGYAAEDVVNSLPLGEGKITGGSMKVAGHPWIDDVVDAEPLWRTHQVGGAVVVRG